MKLTTLTIFALVLLGVSYTQTTQLEILQSWAYARSHPAEISKRITEKYISKGIKGVAGEEECYVETVKFLNGLSGKTFKVLTEDAAIDLAAYSHSQDLLSSGAKAPSHTGSDKSDTESRMRKFGSFIGKYFFFELVSYKRQSEPVGADDIIDSFVSDCTLKDKKNRMLIFSNDVTGFGAGVASAGGRIFVTLMGAKGFIRKSVTNAQLEQARVEGNANYKGTGVQHPNARWRDQKEFAKGTEQVVKPFTPKKLDDSTGPLGDLKDDGSVKCPDFVNSGALEKAVIKQWTVTSKTCVRGKGEFTRTDNLARYAPFAKNNRCYHRLSYCSTKGKVWVFDREYKTLAEVNVKAALIPKKSILGELKDDKTTDCPQWVNGNLRKRIVQDWHKASNDKCKRGTNGFDAKGFKAHRAVSRDKRCYQRNEFCCTGGFVWVKDSEYLTFAEYEARKL